MAEKNPAITQKFNLEQDARLHRRADAHRRLDHGGELLPVELLQRRLVEGVAHFRLHAVPGDLLQPLLVDARVLILVFDLASAFLHRNHSMALAALLAQRDERITPAAETA